MHGSLLFTVPFTGAFLCQIRAQADAGNDLGYHMTAVAAPRPSGTWLEIDNFTGDAPAMRVSSIFGVPARLTGQAEAG